MADVPEGALPNERGNVIGVVDGNEVVRTPYGDQVWSDLLYPGGMVCAWCGVPVESEPCAEHGGVHV